MDLRSAGRRMGVAPAVVCSSLILAVTVFIGMAYAPPSGAAPDKISDADDPSIQAHVTGDGELQVTGEVTLSGTSQVEVTNTPLPVNVENFPGTQDVNVVGGALSGVQLAPATTGFGDFFQIEVRENETATFDPINVTSFFYSDQDDEANVHFENPLVPQLFSRVFADNDGNVESHQQDFVHPFPVSGISVNCQNESEDCEVFILLIGF